MSEREGVVRAADRTTRMIASNGELLVAEYCLVVSLSDTSIESLRRSCGSLSLRRALPLLLEQGLCGNWIVRPGGGLVRADPRVNHGAVMRSAGIVGPLDETVLAFIEREGTASIAFFDDGSRATVHWRGEPRAFALSR